jgi:hypothetical protein
MSSTEEYGPATGGWSGSSSGLDRDHVQPFGGVVPGSKMPEPRTLPCRRGSIDCSVCIRRIPPISLLCPAGEGSIERCTFGVQG